MGGDFRGGLLFAWGVVLTNGKVEHSVKLLSGCFVFAEFLRNEGHWVRGGPRGARGGGVEAIGVRTVAVGGRWGEVVDHTLDVWVVRRGGLGLRRGPDGLAQFLVDYVGNHLGFR